MKHRIIDMGDISALGLESITGFTIVSADSIDDAEKIALSNP